MQTTRALRQIGSNSFSKPFLFVNHFFPLRRPSEAVGRLRIHGPDGLRRAVVQPFSDSLLVVLERAALIDAATGAEQALQFRGELLHPAAVLMPAGIAAMRFHFDGQR